MDEKELEKLETRYRQKTGNDPAVSIPPGGAAEDMGEYVRRAKTIKVAIGKAAEKGKTDVAADYQQQLALLKRVVRARAIQRELNRVEKKPNGFLTPWPDFRA